MRVLSASSVSGLQQLLSQCNDMNVLQFFLFYVNVFIGCLGKIKILNTVFFCSQYLPLVAETTYCCVLSMVRFRLPSSCQLYIVSLGSVSDIG